MRTNQWSKFKAICKQYVGIIVADELLIEEGYNQEYKVMQNRYPDHKAHL